MAERSARKPKRKAEFSPSGASGPAEAEGASLEALRARLAAVESERDALVRELAAARGRIAALEERNAQVVNRIDWMIDSLHNVLAE